jgi:hypothetical protein
VNNNFVTLPLPASLLRGKFLSLSLPTTLNNSVLQKYLNFRIGKGGGGGKFPSLTTKLNPV